MLLLLGFYQNNIAHAADLTGVWTSNDSGLYYLRQIGSTLWWFGASQDHGQSWTNVFHGRIIGNQIVGEWADVPHGRTNNHGTLVIGIRTDQNGQTVLSAISSTGGFGAFRWTINGARPSPLPNYSQDPASYTLKGVWSGNDDGRYYVNVFGDPFHGDLWWVGLSRDEGMTWTNVFHGRMTEYGIMGEWADVPHGRILSSGQMSLTTTYKNCAYTQLDRNAVTGGFGGSRWSKIAVDLPDGLGKICPPITIAEMKDQETFQNLLSSNERDALIGTIGTIEPVDNQQKKLHEVAEKIRILTGTKAIGSRPEFSNLPIQRTSVSKYDIYTLWIPERVNKQEYAILLAAFSDHSTRKLTTDVVSFTTTVAYDNQAYFSKNVVTPSGVSVIILPANTLKFGSDANPIHHSLSFDVGSLEPNASKQSSSLLPMADAISVSAPQEVVVVPEFTYSGLTISLTIAVLLLSLILYLGNTFRRNLRASHNET